MDPNEWKKMKRSGTFKRKIRKTIESLKSEPTSSLFSVHNKNSVQARMTAQEKDNTDVTISALNIPSQEEQKNNIVRETHDDSNRASSELNTSGNERESIELQMQGDYCTDYLEGIELSEETSNSSSISDDDKDLEFRNDLQKWALDCNISHEAVKSLSRILNKRLPNIVPTDPRTLLKTNVMNVVLLTVDAGQYWHNGVSAPLKNILENISIAPDTITLTFNIDGLPLYNSSRQQVWPILCHVFEKQQLPPFVVGIYQGKGKPSDLKAYLHHFVAEMKELLRNGLEITTKNGLKTICTVKIRAFICDSPARALLKGVCNFNGKHGCLKCTVVGEYSHTSHTVVFSKIDCPKRNDADFRLKKYGDHHKYDSPLLELPIDMIEDIPVGDSLHLIDLGIMKRLLTGWRDGNFGKYLTKWCSRDIKKVSDFLNCCKLPSEIHRHVRSLEVLAHWKGSEFLTFLYYLSFIILENVLCSEAFYHFLCFFCAITICSNKKHFTYLRLAEEMLKYFVTTHGNIYGTGYVTSNVHNLSHLVDEVKKFGILQNFNTYPFENKLYAIKKMVRHGNKPLNQIAKRITEKSYVEAKHFEENIKGHPFIKTKRTTHNSVISVLNLEHFILSPQNHNKWFLSTKNHVVENYFSQ